MLHDHPQDFILYTRIRQGLQVEGYLTWGWSSESSFSNLGTYQIPQHVDYWLAALPLGRCSSCELAFRSKALTQGLPGGAVVESLPANAGDTGLSPGLGRSHMPRSD